MLGKKAKKPRDQALLVTRRPEALLYAYPPPDAIEEREAELRGIVFPTRAGEQEKSGKHGGESDMFSKLDPSDEPDREKLRASLPPGQVESGIRQSIQLLWMILPADKRNIDDVEREVRRIVDRIFRNIRDDEQAHPR